MFIHHKHKQAYLHMSKMVNQAYPFNDKKSDCLLWLEPYRNMEFPPELLIWGNSERFAFENYNAKNDTELLVRRPELAARVILATGRPKSAVAAANDFINLEMKNKTYTALHWRYDITDYGNHCRKLNLQWAGPNSKKFRSWKQILLVFNNFRPTRLPFPMSASAAPSTAAASTPLKSGPTSPATSTTKTSTF